MIGGAGKRFRALAAAWALVMVWVPAAGAPAPAGAAPEAGPLDATERAIVQAVDARNDEALALLEKVVNINSGTLNLKGVREVGTIFRKELDALGFTTRWEEGESYQRAGHLVAEHPGMGPRLLLIGHLDTVFEADSPFQRFEKLEGEKARGPGVIDMKGGDVILLQALKALAAAGALERMSLTVFMTGDEEHPGEPLQTARASLVEAARGASASIGFEDGDGKPDHAVIARRGASSWTLKVTGTPAHSSLIFTPEYGPGAIFEAARILDLFRERLAGEENLTFSPGLILGGTETHLDGAGSRGTASGKENVIAEQAVVQGDLRTISPEQLDRTKKAMEGIVGKPLPRTSSEITFQDGYPPMAPSDGNRWLLGMYDRASRDLGFREVTATDPREAGAADASFTAALAGMVLDGVGLKGSGGHTAQETADLEMLPVQTKRAAVFLHRLAEGGRTRP